MRGAEISSDHYLVVLVLKRCWREVRHKRPEEQNTLKWNVRKLGEMKCRKEFGSSRRNLWQVGTPGELSGNGMGRTERSGDRGGQ